MPAVIFINLYSHGTPLATPGNSEGGGNTTMSVLEDEAGGTFAYVCACV